MKKNHFHLSLRRCMLSFLVLCAAILISVPVSAASAWTSTQLCPVTKPVTTYKLALDPGGTYVKNSLKVTKGSQYAKVSVTYSKEFKHYDISVKPKKAGYISIQFKYRKNGKTTTYKQKFHITKYNSPIQSFKVGSTDYASKFKTTDCVNVKKKVSGKLKISPADDWEISAINLIKKNGNGSPVKNGKKITLSKGSYLMVTLQNGDEYRTVKLNYDATLYNYLAQNGG